ncbi:hypothetical protein CAR_c07460 [Carnobacterium sp. 17-4]|uniref:DUF3899 domain-containing protein n=1 Tax=Carnobacterium sp. (strain 17-4) TaxID=208596 RepID=UPI00020589D1|nr:DUF3899 domain-containing protein [Carnobacterium sp. 17-4]AEB29440.1 hypothetical protein CAR_c07460 [Carnobacterium sp. 17-4]
MKQKFTPIRIFLAILVLCILLELIIYRELSFYHTTNLTFYGAAFFLIIGLFGASFSSGFFDFFNYSMRKAAFNIRKGRNSDEELNVEPLSKVFGKGYYFFLKVGSALLIVCILTLLAYYLIER